MCKTCVLNIEKWWWRKLKKFYIKGKVYCDYVLKDDVVKMSCMHAQSLQTLCAPVDCSPPGSSVHGILQTRVQEWFAISSSRGSSWPKDWTHISCSGRRVLYYWATWEADLTVINIPSAFSMCLTLYWHFHFTDVETEAQRVLATCLAL